MARIPVYLGVLAAAALVCVIIGHVLQGKIRPTGDLGRWYEVPTCHDSSIPSKSYNVFPLAHGSLSGNPDAPCSMSALSSQDPVRIRLEATDGFRLGGSYSGTVLLGSGNYALLAISVTDQNGLTLLPAGNAELGPDFNFPWRSKNFAQPDVAAPPPSSSFRQLETWSVGASDSGKGMDGGGGEAWSLLEGLEVDEDMLEDEPEWSLEEWDALEALAVDGTEDEDIGEGRLPPQDELLLETESSPSRRRGGGFSRSFSSGRSFSSSRSSYSSSSSRAATTSSRAASSSSRSSTYTNRGSSYGSSGRYASSYASYHTYGYSPYGYHAYGYASPFYYSPLGFYHPFGYPLYVGHPFTYNLYTSYFLLGASLSVVHPYHYGYYGYYGGAYGHGGAYAAQSRAQAQQLGSNQDLYQLSGSFKAPGRDGWPIYLDVHNATIFSSQSSTTPSPLYISFRTPDGASYRTYSRVLLVAGYLTLLITLCCMCKVHEDEDDSDDDSPRPQPSGPVPSWESKGWGHNNKSMR